MRTTRLRVTLRDVVPTVQRVIDVPAAITLDELHDVLQVALGWTDSHLHLFRTDTQSFVASLDDDFGGDDEVVETGVRLSTLPPRFAYLYDFGDGWEHDVEALGRGGDLPGCIDGQGACPPEDCGGPYGYAELLETLAQPRHPDHVAMREWVGDRLPPFDLDVTARRVTYVVGLVPGSVRLLLELLADGVKLTPGGRLPRTVVRAVQDQRPAWYPLDRPASVEEDLLPLAALHDVLRHVGLLRLANGVLRPIKAAADDVEVVRRLRSWFEPGEFTTLVIERALALVVVRSSATVAELAAVVFPMLGHGWRLADRPLSAADVENVLHRSTHQLRALDLVTGTWKQWSPGPSARSLLPGTALLADLV